MPEISEFLEQFQPTIGDVSLPGPLSARYEPVSELGPAGAGSVWLLRRREDGARFVLKSDRGDGQDLMEEFRLLARLPAGVGPEPEACFVEGGVTYLLLSYLPGRTLDEAWTPGGPLPDWTAMGKKLCALLARLHRLEPPIVHRDVKPENIVVSPQGEPRLIDFGIARRYKPERDTDTVRMGTRATAAPEQYGFTQSDQRTDLYALGVTLRWMLTGSYAPEALEESPCPAWVKRFLRRAAAFDPGARFPSAEAMAAVLRRHTAGGRRRRLAASAVLACLACALAFPLLSAAGQLASYAGEKFGPDFGSPLLEAAVRAELNRPEGPITREDLRKVRRLAVVGQKLMGEDQTYSYVLCSYVDWESQQEEPHGDIADLSLLRDMPNLEVLCLCQQEIRDLAPLAELTGLRELYLPDNAIEDLSPLKDLPGLEALYIGNNPVRDLSPLSGLRTLRTLNLDNLNARTVDSLSPLAGLHTQCVSLGYVEPADRDWSFLSRLVQLDQLSLWDPPPEAVASLGTCSSLRELCLGNYSGGDLSALPAVSGLRSLRVLNGLLSVEGIARQERLAWLDLFGLPDMDLTPLAGLRELRSFSTSQCPFSDFSPLAELPALQNAELWTECREAFAATCPHPSFSVTYR